MYKLRNGAYQQNGNAIKVLTVPNEIAEFYESTYFKVEKIDDKIIFTSGTKTISKNDVENYKFEDCRI